MNPKEKVKDILYEAIKRLFEIYWEAVDEIDESGFSNNPFSDDDMEAVKRYEKELLTLLDENPGLLISNNILRESEGIRPMTPLEHQWMDFKKILSELVVFQEEYEENTKDYLPGNKYYADKLMAIVNKAKQAINAQESDDENTGNGVYLMPMGSHESNPFLPPATKETDKERTKRVIEEYLDWYDNLDGYTKRDLPHDYLVDKWLNQEPT